MPHLEVAQSLSCGAKLADGYHSKRSRPICAKRLLRFLFKQFCPNLDIASSDSKATSECIVNARNQLTVRGVAIADGGTYGRLWREC